jgi:predicted MFS family arabinose efflux permease
VSVKRLRRQPGYLLFYTAATVVRVGMEMFSVAVVLLVLKRTGSAATAGATVAAITFPALFSGPLLGAWLDLTGRRRAIMLFDQALIVAALVSILLVTGHAPNWVVPLIALAAGVTHPLPFGGFTSMIPVLVPDELLPSANAFEGVSFNAALVAGPALAGALAAAFGPPVAVLSEAGLALAGLALIAALPALDTEPHPHKRSLLGVAADGLRLLARAPVLRAITASAGVYMAATGLLTVAFPFFAAQDLGAGHSAAGALWSAFAAGSAVGALLGPRLLRRARPENVVIASFAGFGLIALLWPLASSLVPALLLVALAGVADGPGLTATFSLRQEQVPRELYGQVFSTASSIKVGSFAAGSAIAGPLVIGIGARGTLVITACVSLASAALAYAMLRSAPRKAVSRQVPLLEPDRNERDHQDHGRPHDHRDGQREPRPLGDPGGEHDHGEGGRRQREVTADM